MEKMDTGYMRGFTDGLLTVKKLFESIGCDFGTMNKHLTFSLADQLIDCAIENRRYLRDPHSINFGFIRWNVKKNCFEWHSLS